MSKPFSVPVGDEDTWSDIATKEFDANAKAHYALLQVLNDDDIVRFIFTAENQGLGYEGDVGEISHK